MKALIVHNSDEVVACFIGETDLEIIKKLKKNQDYWQDIMDRLNEGEDENTEEYVLPDDVTMYDITDLYHDGDSEDGYTLIDAI